MLIRHLNQRLHDREAQSLRRERRVVEGPCAIRVQVTRASGTPQTMLSFCSNDYLGLANHPVLVDALREGAERWGVGGGASHLISGHSRAHEALEQELSDLLGANIPSARALSFSNGYMANIAVLTALGGSDATIFADKLNHASLIDGAKLAEARTQRYPHGRVDLLQKQLSASDAPIKLIVTDAVFSMDGDLAPLVELLALAERFDAWIVVDDAHGFGVLGEHGGGSLSSSGLRSERFIYMGTLGKAAGVSGAFVAASAPIIEWLIQSARTYIYTTAASPAIAHALLASVRLIRAEEGAQRRAKLAASTRFLREGVNGIIEKSPGLGWKLAESNTAIQPLIVGGTEAASELSAALEAKGIWVPAIRPPTVREGSARLRITLSAAHDASDVRALIEALDGIAGESA